MEIEKEEEGIKFKLNDSYINLLGSELSKENLNQLFEEFHTGFKILIKKLIELYRKIVLFKEKDPAKKKANLELIVKEIEEIKTIEKKFLILYKLILNIKKYQENSNNNIKSNIYLSFESEGEKVEFLKTLTDRSEKIKIFNEYIKKIEGIKASIKDFYEKIVSEIDLDE